MNSGQHRGGILMTMHRLSQGGADRVGVLLANGFVRAGIPTRFLLLRDGGEAEKELLAMMEADVSVSVAGPPMGSRHLELVRGLKFIRSEIRSCRPGLVLASSSNMGLVTGLSRQIGSDSSPSFAMKLTNPVIRPRDRGAPRTLYRRKLYDFIFSKYDLIATLTDAERTYLARQHPRSAHRFHTIPNPYVSDEMHLQPSPRAEPGSVRLLCAARMMPQKRLDVLLRAFALTSAADSSLTILGDGPLRPMLERLSKSLGIAGRVRMPGFVEDITPWLHDSDLLVLSSDYEGLPAVILEALACGVPVASTDCFFGAREMLAELKPCAVVPINNPQALAAAIDRCLAGTIDQDRLQIAAGAYRIKEAIAAHIRAFTPLLDAHAHPTGEEASISRARVSQS